MQHDKNTSNPTEQMPLIEWGEFNGRIIDAVPIKLVPKLLAIDEDGEFSRCEFATGRKQFRVSIDPTVDREGIGCRIANVVEDYLEEWEEEEPQREETAEVDELKRTSNQMANEIKDLERKVRYYQREMSSLKERLRKAREELANTGATTCTVCGKFYTSAAGLKRHQSKAKH